VRRLAAALALAALVGCGSTVQVGTAAVPADGLTTGTTGAGPVGTAGTTTGGGSTGLSAGTAGSAVSTTGTSGSKSATSTGTTTGATESATTGVIAGKVPGRHPGVDDKTVKLGFLYLASAGTVLGGFGVQGYSQGDELGVARALIDDQNRRGGLAGRTIELVPRDLGGLDNSSYQAACDFFTQDERVFMVLTGLGHSAVLNSCLARRGVGYTSDYVPPSDRLMRRLGPIYAPDDMSAERFAVLVARSMVTSGLFPRGAKVGVIRQDDPDWARLTAQVVRPLLTQAGVQVVAEEAYNANDASAYVSGAPGVTFRLRAAGVTHVLSYETPLFYMTAAQSQDWHPYWTVSTKTAPGAFMEGAVPAEQLRNSGGPGWAPSFDLATNRIKGYVSSEERRCLDVLRKAGYSYSGTPRAVAQMICGEAFHIARVMERVSEVSTKGFQLAAESLPSYPSPVSFSLSFAGGRHDGASSYRMVRYLSSCSCFGYTTPLRPIPTT
jgi:hypothetical protein